MLTFLLVQGNIFFFLECPFFHVEKSSLTLLATGTATNILAANQAAEAS